MTRNLLSIYIPFYAERIPQPISQSVSPTLPLFFRIASLDFRIVEVSHVIFLVKLEMLHTLFPLNCCLLLLLLFLLLWWSIYLDEIILLYNVCRTADGLWPDYNDGTWPSCCTESEFDEKEVHCAFVCTYSFHWYVIQFCEEINIMETRLWSTSSE